MSLWVSGGFTGEGGYKNPVCWSQDPSTQGEWGSPCPAPWSPGSQKERISEQGLQFLTWPALGPSLCTKQRPGSKQPTALWPKPCKSLGEELRWLGTPLTGCHLKREGRYFPLFVELWVNCEGPRSSNGRQEGVGPRRRRSAPWTLKVPADGGSVPREPAWEQPCVSTRARRDPWKWLATPAENYSPDFIYTHNPGDISVSENEIYKLLHFPLSERSISVSPISVSASLPSSPCVLLIGMLG